MTTMSVAAALEVSIKSHDSTLGNVVMPSSNLHGREVKSVKKKLQFLEQLLEGDSRNLHVSFGLDG